MTGKKKTAKKTASKKKQRATKAPDSKQEEGNKWKEFLHRHTVKEEKK